MRTPLPRLFQLFVGLLLTGSCGPSAFAQTKFPTFVPQTIDPDIGRVCYAVTLANVNHDDHLDIVAISERRVIWYEAPDWQPHVILEDQVPLDHVTIAPADIDGDGLVDFALGAGWTKQGTLHWLRRGEHADAPWEVRTIGEEPWLHRARFADVLGLGRPQLVISPLNATQGTGVRLMAFEIPTNPLRDRWPVTILDDELNAMHNHWHMDWDEDGLQDTLTASREGIHLIRRDGSGWTKTKLSNGATNEDPALCGAGEIKVGKLASGGKFLVSVEPMHGDTLAVYTAPAEAGQLWRRHVIDQGFQRGHAIWTADLTGDGSDEIIFGHSDTPEVPGVNAYRATAADGTQWEKHVLDAGGMATEDLIVADLTGDGRADIVAGGRATRNVKLYINTP